MWISKQKYLELMDRLNQLEYQAKQFNRVHATCDGTLYSNSSGEVTVVDALNALAKGVGFKWKTEWAKPASIQIEKDKK